MQEKKRKKMHVMKARKKMKNGQVTVSLVVFQLHFIHRIDLMLYITMILNLASIYLFNFELYLLLIKFNSVGCVCVSVDLNQYDFLFF